MVDIVNVLHPFSGWNYKSLKYKMKEVNFHFCGYRDVIHWGLFYKYCRYRMRAITVHD